MAPEATCRSLFSNVLGAGKRTLKETQKFLIGQEAAQYEPETSYQEPKLSALLRLPPEIWLCITNQLEIEYQIMLRLTCKHLFTLLRSTVDLPLYNPVRRLRALRCLEIDHSDLLICRTCVRMFRWREQESVTYVCPRSLRHSWDGELYCEKWTYDGQQKAVTQEIIDLIFRARKRGPTYGLLPSVLNTCTYTHYDTCESMRYDMTRETKAAFANGQLLFLSNTYTEVGSPEEAVERVAPLEWTLCRHRVWSSGEHIGRYDEIWQTVSKIPEMVQHEESELPNCGMCATNARIYIDRMSKDRFRMGMKVWRNFGNGDVGVRTDEQMFCYRWPHQGVDADEAFQGNTKAILETLPASSPRVRTIQTSRFQEHRLNYRKWVEFGPKYKPHFNLNHE